MSVLAFNERYRFARPVVLRGAVDATWPAWQRWTRAELLRRHGARRVKVGRSQALVENLGDGTNATQLGAFVRACGARPRRGRGTSRCTCSTAAVSSSRRACSPHRAPLFDAALAGGGAADDPDGLAAGLPPPSAAMSFYFLLGGARSNTPFHTHSDGWNALVSARSAGSSARRARPRATRRAARAAGSSSGSRRTTRGCARERRGPLECTQGRRRRVRARELVPRDGSRGETLGVAAQFETARTLGLRMLTTRSTRSPRSPSHGADGAARGGGGGGGGGRGTALDRGRSAAAGARCRRARGGGAPAAARDRAHAVGGALRARVGRRGAVQPRSSGRGGGDAARGGRGRRG